MTDFSETDAWIIKFADFKDDIEEGMYVEERKRLEEEN